jgi:hypothetical protein
MGVRSPSDGFAQAFQGNSVETAYRPTKFLLGLLVPDIIASSQNRVRGFAGAVYRV